MSAPELLAHLAQQASAACAHAVVAVPGVASLSEQDRCKVAVMAGVGLACSVASGGGLSRNYASALVGALVEQALEDLYP